MPGIQLAECGVKFGTSGVRGLVSELNDEICYAFTAAFCRTLVSDTPVVIGHDLRPSSPEITAFCVRALEDLGVPVIYVGALPTPAIAYYALSLGYPCMVVTGSHIPFDRNGIKFYAANGEISKADEQAMLAQRIEVPGALTPAVLPPPNPAARELYLKRYTEAFPADLCQGLKVAIYQHSSVARDLLVELFRSFGAQVVELGRTDHFVPIDTEAVREEDQRLAQTWAREQHYDLLVSTDGDADRPLIADEQGQFLRGDGVGALCALALGVRELVTPVSSNTAVERSGLFERVVRTRIGSPYVIAAMAESTSDSVAGYEANGGFLLGQDLTTGSGRLAALPTRDAVLPMLALILLAKQRGLKLSGLAGLLPPRYTASDRIPETPAYWSASLLARLSSGDLEIAALLPEDQGAVVSVDQTDGYRVLFEAGTIVHLRPSGNAPELRCYTEADTDAEAQSLCQGVLVRVSERYRTESASL